ncbi:sensor histidine kinase [Spirillospora sp. NPDC050679]
MKGVLRAPFSRRAWAEVLYVLAGLPLTVLSVLYAVAGSAVSLVFSVTRIGGPVTRGVHRGARRIGDRHRRLAASLLHEPIARDDPGLRTLLYLAARLPLSIVGAVVLYFTWICGVLLLGYPFYFQLGLNRIVSRDSAGQVREGMHLGGLYFDDFAKSLLVGAVGLVLLLVAPWVMRAAVRLDLATARALLGPRPGTARIRALEESRSFAVQDAVATLRRIERDLHDGAQVQLIALTMRLAMLRELLPADAPESTRELVESAHGDARQAIAELRELVRGIHPPTLDKGLDVALATLAARSPVPAELETDLPERPAPAIESIAYFCVSELLANAGKHAEARRVTIRADQPAGTLRLRVADDGCGGARIGAGSGLTGLSERVRTVDGDLHVSSPPGGPTTVTVTLPLSA